ncbi:hypothetical protein [Candidatus Poriferisocius sp.]|uniref:hypothetical protein n=1 Tax=Candidatus Poriferisocius sp. TaxID=3101276 RepID=UPI003B58D131
MDVSPDEGQADSPAKVRHSRWKSLAPIAALALLAAGFGTWQLLDRSGPDNEVHVTGPEIASTGPVLEWTEFDPGFDETEAFGLLQSLGDGRTLFRLFDLNDNSLQFLITVNGSDWTPVPMPEGFLPLAVDFSGPRWLVAGLDDIQALDGVDEWGVDETGSVVVPRERIFYSDDEGANWTELGIDFTSRSSGGSGEATGPRGIRLIRTALASGDNMVVVTVEEVQNEEPASGQVDGQDERGRSLIYASDGGDFELVAEYGGWVHHGVTGASYSTPAGFHLQLYVEGGTDQERGRLSTLTSPDGRIWSESESAAVLFTFKALGPDGSLWTTVWLGAGYGLHRFDREGTLTTEVAFDNLIPFRVAAGPAGFVVNAMTSPGTDLFTLPNKRIAKGGYELRLNEPEGGFTLWDLSADVAVYECQREVLWAQGMGPDEEAVCEFTYPGHDNADMDAVVLVFEDQQTGDRLVSFTRRELLPTFPLWLITGLDVDGAEHQQWLAWSTDGVEWGWQTTADAFPIDPSEANDAMVELAVGDGSVLARVQQMDDSPPYYSSIRWFIAQVP